MYARHIVPQRLFMMLRIIGFLPLSEQTLADAIIEFCTDMVLDFLFEPVHIIRANESE